MDTEYYISCHIDHSSSLTNAVLSLQNRLRAYSPLSPILLRFFCSDVYNQTPAIEKLWPREPGTQRVYIGQRPLDSAYVSIQAYFLSKIADISSDDNDSLSYKHGAYESLWTLDYPGLRADSAHQTTQIIKSAQAKLQSRGMTLNPDVIRAWYYLRDIDNNYAGMIKSRLYWYETNGLTAATLPIDA